MTPGTPDTTIKKSQDAFPNATPRPWCVQDNTKRLEISPVRPDGQWVSMIAQVYKSGRCNANSYRMPARANAELIVTAVNSYDALRESLKHIAERNGRRECERYSTGIGSCFKQGRRVDAQFAAEKCCASCIADAALALVDVPATEEVK